MFIDGIAGMANTTVTVASPIGRPSALLTVAASVAGPAFKGSGETARSIGELFSRGRCRGLRGPGVCVSLCGRAELAFRVDEEGRALGDLVSDAQAAA